MLKKYNLSNDRVFVIKRDDRSDLRLHAVRSLSDNLWHFSRDKDNGTLSKQLSDISFTKWNDLVKYVEKWCAYQKATISEIQDIDLLSI